MMNKKQWVDVRRKTLTDFYDLPAEEQQRADEFFAKTEALAATCEDQTAFEQQMVTSGLNEEYSKLMASFGKYAKMPDGQKVPTAKDAALKIAAGAPAAMAETHINSTIRREVNTAIENATGIKLYSGVGGALLHVPVIGSILSWMNTFNWFRRMFGKRKSVEDMQQE